MAYPSLRRLMVRAIVRTPLWTGATGRTRLRCALTAPCRLVLGAVVRAAQRCSAARCAGLGGSSACRDGAPVCMRTAERCTLHRLVCAGCAIALERRAPPRPHGRLGRCRLLRRGPCQHSFRCLRHGDRGHRWLGGGGHAPRLLAAIRPAGVAAGGADVVGRIGLHLPGRLARPVVPPLTVSTRRALAQSRTVRHPIPRPARPERLGWHRVGLRDARSGLLLPGAGGCLIPP